MVVVRVAEPEELSTCLAIRHEVFVVGQGVPEVDEADGLDDDCVHFLVVETVDGPIGTARLRDKGGRAKVERVAVVDAWRGHGVGARLMEHVEDVARRRGFTDAVLAAQVSVVGFYERLGWVAHGEVFVEAGIDHQWMAKPL